ncbi:RidA family protein [Bradyrhizobium sp. 14AA]
MRFADARARQESRAHDENMAATVKTGIQVLAILATVVSLQLSSPSARADDVPFSTRTVAIVPSHHGKISDIVAINGRSRTIFVSGVGAEDEDSTTQYAPQVRYRGEFSKQCDYALKNFGRMLGTRNAGLGDIAMLRVYLIDARNVGDLYTCIDQRFADLPRPALTVADISQLAHAGMMIEIEATASLAASGNDTAFTIFRNKETLGKWNVGATEVLEVSGRDSTTCVSGLHAVQKGSGTTGLPIAMLPQDFIGQCGYVQKKMKAEMVAPGGSNDNVIRSTTFVTGDCGSPIRPSAARSSPRRIWSAFPAPF